MICENVAGASRSSPLIGRLAQKQNARGETPPQRPGARRASHFFVMSIFTNPHARQDSPLSSELESSVIWAIAG